MTSMDATLEIPRQTAIGAPMSRSTAKEANKTVAIIIHLLLSLPGLFGRFYCIGNNVLMLNVLAEDKLD